MRPRKLNTSLGFFLYALFFPSIVFAQDISVSWIAPTTSQDGTVLTDLDRYLLKRSLSSGDYASAYIQTVPASQTLVVQPRPAPGSYFWVVTAVDTSGNESLRSNEASLVVVLPTPTPTPTPTLLATDTPSPTLTSIPTITPTASLTMTATYTSTPTVTKTPTLTRTPFPTWTTKPTATIPVPTNTPTATPTLTPTRTFTRTPTLTPTRTPFPTWTRKGKGHQKP